MAIAKNLVPLRTALFSVADKTNLIDFATSLYEINPDLVIYSTGGTARRLRGEDKGYEGPQLPEKYKARVLDVSQLTGLPESPDDLLKTLVPEVHGAFLLDHSNSDHLPYMIEQGIGQIDLVVNNPYPFEDVVADPDKSPIDKKNNIDIGGPTMLHSAAKNFARVAAVSSPEQYQQFLGELGVHEGATTLPFRRRLAAEAFTLTSKFYGHVGRWLTVDTEAIEAAYLGD